MTLLRLDSPYNIASHRVHRFEAWLVDHLTNFRMRQEGLISHIPKSLRSMTMRDFAKYDGDIQNAVQGLLAENYGQVEGIDRPTRKRKWIESQEQEAEAAGPKAGIVEEGSKPFKTGMWYKFWPVRRLMMPATSSSPSDCCHTEETCCRTTRYRSCTSADHDEDPVTCMLP